MTTPVDVWNLDTHRIGRRVLVYDVVDSTNNLAAALATDPANDGVAILASRQTAGRGQHGRTWQTPAGSAVLLSVLCFPPPPVRRAAVLTAWAAVAVCETVRDITGSAPTIKWPNDVLIDGRKICGILTEQSRGTVIGIGLNVNQSAEDFAAAGLPEATSLRLQTRRNLECADVARLLLWHLDKEYERLLAGDLTTLQEKWRTAAGLVGFHVRAECSDGMVQGRLLDMAFEGVLLEVGGETRFLIPEAVQRLVQI
jgi:BirA family transcriptional regulator, biotin operon repressor / biotin---[acetyl-CoA-carboxylase] ligase